MTGPNTEHRMQGGSVRTSVAGYDTARAEEQGELVKTVREQDAAGHRCGLITQALQARLDEAMPGQQAHHLAGSNLPAPLRPTIATDLHSSLPSTDG